MLVATLNWVLRIQRSPRAADSLVTICNVMTRLDPNDLKPFDTKI